MSARSRTKPPPPPGPPPRAPKTVSSRLPVPDGTTHLVTKASASYLAGNLSCDGVRFAYASGRRPVIARYTAESLARGGCVTSKGSFTAPDALAAAALLPVASGHALVLATPEGDVHALDADGRRLSSSETQSCRGAEVTSLASDGGARVFVGCERGGVRVLSLGAGAALRHEATLAGVARPVLALAAGGDAQLLACGCADGAVVLVDPRAAADAPPVAETRTSEYPITCVAWCGPNVMAGNGVGRLYVLCGATGRKLAEVSAHTRPVSALAAHPTRLAVASVSEDTWAHVWSVPAAADHISCTFSRRVDSSILTGAAFCGRNGDTLAMSAYDSGTIRLLDTAATK